MVREPPDVGALVAALGGGRRPAESRRDALAAGAKRSGRLLVEGGRRFDPVREPLLSRYSGSPGGVDAIVVVRERPADLSGRVADAVDVLEDGLIDGMSSTGAAMVGVERSDTEESAVSFFDERGVATVDNVDQLPGRVALVFSLAGAEGNFGVKETADRLLPDLLAPLEPPSGRARGG